MKKLIISLYRKLYDFPFNWKPYGWEKNEMTNFYWSGKTKGCK